MSVRFYVSIVEDFSGIDVNNNYTAVQKEKRKKEKKEKKNSFVLFLFLHAFAYVLDLCWPSTFVASNEA